MSEIEIERDPTNARLEELGIEDWPIWTKEPSEFPWTYDQQERCYLLDGEVEITPEGGQPVTIRRGDYVTFPQGMSCTWKVRHPVRKHYTFD